MSNLAALPFCPYRYMLITSYLGTKYYGSQRLAARGSIGDLPTIQETLESCLERFFPRKKCGLTAASRTDRGVHALMNVYTLPLMDYKTPTSKLKAMINNVLLKQREDIIVKDVILSPSLFHPRRSCISREYLYRIAVPRGQKSLQLSESNPHKPTNFFHLLPVTEMYRCLPLPRLDVDKAQQVIELLNGEHDFKSFCFSPKETDKTIRTLEISMITENHDIFGDQYSCPFDIYQFKFKSHSFLHNQVRRMIGVLITYATYDIMKFEEIETLLNEASVKAWKSNYIIAEPYGLFLKRLNYNKSDVYHYSHTISHKAFVGSKRTHEGHDEEEDVDIDTVEGSSDETMSDDQEKSNAQHNELMMEFFSKKCSEGSDGAESNEVKPTS